MAATENQRDNGTVSLDKIVLYLLTKASEEVLSNGYKIPISDVHNLLEPLEEDLNERFQTQVKFHRSSEEVHSRQVERALNDIIPYKIPVRNPSFSLEISEDIRDMALKRVASDLTSDHQRALNEFIQNEEFRENLGEHAEKI